MRLKTGDIVYFQGRSEAVKLETDQNVELSALQTVGRAISSTMISNIAYNFDWFVMMVQFQNGDWYRYDLVPPDIFVGQLDAASAGKYFAANIRDKYPTRKIVST